MKASESMYCSARTGPDPEHGLYSGVCPPLSDHTPRTCRCGAARSRRC